MKFYEKTGMNKIFLRNSNFVVCISMIATRNLCRLTRPIILAHSDTRPRSFQGVHTGGRTISSVKRVTNQAKLQSPYAQRT